MPAAGKRAADEDAEDAGAVVRVRTDDRQDAEDAKTAVVVGNGGISAKDIGGLYLETVDRTHLDFDFEKLCSVSLSNINVYACLVCGKYFQGRGRSSHAYFHSMNDEHHVFINLKTLSVYVLPDGYEVKDASLNDIKYVLKPTFTKEMVNQLDQSSSPSYDLYNKQYIPGFVGLNNIKLNDYVNVVLHAFAHVKTLRDYFLVEKEAGGSELVCRFGTLIRKIWNARAFKGQVSPHELIQEITNTSQKRYKLGEQADAAEFMSWFINTLHRSMVGKKTRESTIFQQSFQGELMVETETLSNTESDKPDAMSETTTARTPFWFLTLEPPPAPLFTDEADKNIIPQVPLATLLAKYDGVTLHRTNNTQKRYKIVRLPKYLILCIKRFSKNNWQAVEKNPTIVNFPIKNLDMSEYVESNTPARYDLIANICHEGRPGNGNGEYKVHVLSRSKEQWYQIQDLFVEPIMAQMILLAESYIQIWQHVDA